MKLGVFDLHSDVSIISGVHDNIIRDDFFSSCIIMKKCCLLLNKSQHSTEQLQEVLLFGRLR